VASGRYGTGKNMKDFNVWPYATLTYDFVRKKHNEPIKSDLIGILLPIMRGIFFCPVINRPVNRPYLFFISKANNDIFSPF